MLNQVLHYLHNYFTIGDGYEDTYEIEGGSIALSFLKNYQYFMISGSVFNDGVHCYPADDLIDETFTGTITPMAIPKELQMIVDEMEEWEEKNGSPSPFQSESFGGYSYSRATSSSGGTVTVIDAFSNRLKRWKKI